MLEFKWRMHDPAIGRFIQIDPLAEDYVYNGTYNFAENRVIDGNELEGLEWVDAKGNKVYDPSVVNEDGTRGAFTEHATNTHRNLGKFLRGTKTGNEQFNKLVNSDHPIQTNFDSNGKPVRSFGGKLELGTTHNEVDEQTTMDFSVNPPTKEVTGVTVKSSIITLHGGSIDEAIEILKEHPNHVYAGLEFFELLAATLGHEIEHTTDENASITPTGGSNQDKEKPAEAISEQIAREYKEEKKD